jgi:hypothetical protein
MPAGIMCAVTASPQHPAIGTRPVKRKFELTPVRRRDVRRLREFGPPFGMELPPKHGGKDDPRYPSKDGLRTVLGFAIDLLVVHIGGAVAVGFAFAQVPKLSSDAVLAGIGAFVGLSIVHRVLVQWAFATTLGKALWGLVMIRDDTGGRPTLWSLVKAWMIGAFTLTLAVLSN